METSDNCVLHRRKVNGACSVDDLARALKDEDDVVVKGEMIGATTSETSNISQTCCNGKHTDDADSTDDLSADIPTSDPADNDGDDDDDNDSNMMSSIAPCIQRSLQQLWGLDDKSTAELFAMPGRAFDKADKMARQAWEAVEPINTSELLAMSGRALDKAEEMARQAWDVIHHKHLPGWLKDNDFIVRGHRPPLNSFVECFKSIFRIHSETGNIWTHLVGFIAFIIITIWYWSRTTVELRQKAVFTAFFVGAILCLGFSFLFHTLYCHSEKVGRIFCKLDYCGIAMLVIGSFVPWLYYCFYCNPYIQTFYTALIIVLGSICIIVSMLDRFGEPMYRPLRAGVFVSLGLSGVIPSGHYIYMEGLYHAVEYGGFGYLVLMGVTYIAGALIYALRFPERLWPGKFDIWFSSHQIFHVFVLAGAFIHYYGMSVVAHNQMSITSCST